MTLNKFNFAGSDEAKVYGASIIERVEGGREAIEPAARRTAGFQPAATA